jgi:hypothetical protein
MKKGLSAKDLEKLFNSPEYKTFLREAGKKDDKIESGLTIFKVKGLDAYRIPEMVFGDNHSVPFLVPESERKKLSKRDYIGRDANKVLPKDCEHYCLLQTHFHPSKAFMDFRPSKDDLRTLIVNYEVSEPARPITAIACNPDESGVRSAFWSLPSPWILLFQRTELSDGEDYINLYNQINEDNDYIHNVNAGRYTRQYSVDEAKEKIQKRLEGDIKNWESLGPFNIDFMIYGKDFSILRQPDFSKFAFKGESK